VFPPQCIYKHVGRARLRGKALSLADKTVDTKTETAELYTERWSSTDWGLAGARLAKTRHTDDAGLLFNAQGLLAE